MVKIVGERDRNRIPKKTQRRNRRSGLTILKRVRGRRTRKKRVMVV